MIFYQDLDLFLASNWNAVSVVKTFGISLKGNSGKMPNWNKDK